ncbi:MAG: EAL domain-containing protein [Elainellaceae cyanobacterium]
MSTSRGRYQDLRQAHRALQKAYQQLKLEKENFQNLLGLASDGYLVTDSSGRILTANAAMALRLNMPEQFITGKTLLPYLSAESRAIVHNVLAQASCSNLSNWGKTHALELTFQPCNIQPFKAAVTLVATQVVQGARRNVNLLWQVSEISRQSTSIDSFCYLAFHDSLTGLPNRSSFDAHLDQVLAKPAYSPAKVALILLDLDGFKQVNDTYGHPAGDSLLQSVAQQIRSCLREQDVVYRWGGDEFALILEPVRDIGVAEHICERVLSHLTQFMFRVSGRTLRVSASLGGVVFSPNGQSARSLLRAADAALYEVKRAGRCSYRLYNTDLSLNQVVRLNLESNLRQALKERELKLYFQPQINYLTRKVVGLEALIRWQHPQLGLLPPASFIALAESSNLAFDLGKWVLEEAIAQAQSWKVDGTGPVVAINSSPVQFQQLEYASLIEEMLKATSYNPAFLEIEMTEATAINRLRTTQNTLKAIARQGVKITLDDFGTGYSEFARLKQLPLHGIKIDRSLISELGQNSPDQAIAAAIIALAKALKLAVVAEGVETSAQADILKSMGCTVMQGYLFSQPLQPEQVAELCWPRQS